MGHSNLKRRSWWMGWAAGLAALALGLAWSGPALAGDVAALPANAPAEPLLLAERPPAPADDWAVVLRLGLWAMNVDGSATSGDRNVDFSMDFADILDNTSFALMPGVEVGKGRWAILFNGVFARLENEESFSRTGPAGRVREGSADITMDMYIADLGVGYRLCDIPLGQMTLSLMPSAGIRYTYLSLEIDPERLDSRKRDGELWDPYVGGRVNLQINKSLAWRTEGTVGGFGVGSDFAWAAQSFIDWRFSRSWELNVGYRAIYYDCDEGDLEMDMTMHGPWLGFSYWVD